MRTFDDIAHDVWDALRKGNIQTLEELDRELRSMPEVDIRLVECLILFTNASVATLVGEIDTALSMLSDTLKKLTLPQEQQWIAEVHSQVGMLYVSKGDFERAHQELARSLDLFEQIGDRASVARVLVNTGILFLQLHDPSSAMERLHHAIRINQERGIEDGVFAALFNMASAHQHMGDYPTALQTLHRCLSYYEECGQSTSIANCLNNIAIIHYNMEEWATALECFERSLEVYRALGQYGRTAFLVRNIGNCHAALKNDTAAMEQYRTALDLAQRSGEDQNGVGIRLSIINQLGKQQRFTEVDEALRELEGMHISNKGHQVSILEYRSRLHAILNNDLVAARELCLAALKIAESSTMLRTEMGCHKQLRDIALELQDLASYVEHNNAYLRIKEEISGKEASKMLAMQAKEREIAERDKEHAKQLAVLHSTLPKHIADRVARGEVVNDHYDNAAVIFLDIVGFTTLSEQLSSAQVVQLLESVFTALDDVCKNHDVVKIKTIGDSYMAVAFPHSVRNDSALTTRERGESVIPSEAREVAWRTANAALDMLESISHIVSPTGSPIEVRLGVHCGAVTAG
ncbi:MAG: hypothetical protein EHM43_11540, partial [Ignavibacteriae bacterium]